MNKSRIISAYLFVIIGSLILAGRYFYLQISDHRELLSKAVNNYSSNLITLPARGIITDSQGVSLAFNKIAYAVAILPKNAKHIDRLFQRLESYIHLTVFDKKRFLRLKNQAKNYDWVIIKDDLSDNEVAYLTSHSYLFPELNLYAHTKRYYPYKDLYAPSLGYVGRLSANDKKRLTKLGSINNYMANDYIGKAGLEYEYESWLRGKVGKKVIQTDALGNEIGLINSIQAKDGDTLVLTINNNLQQLAYNLLANRKGAIVAINPQTGGILTFVSKPSFDANLFLDGISPEDWDDLRNDSNTPLLNRASFGTYPPGSTFKPFLAACALYLGIRKPDYRFHDVGYFVIPGSKRKFRNSGNEVLGNIGITDALAHSSDAFFYKLGLDLGIDNIDKTMPMFGFGVKTGIDLPQEASGLLPSRTWKAKRFHKDSYQKNWLAADSVNVGVGQGFNHYTPLQMAYAVSILANNGITRRPHFLAKVINESGIVIESYTEVPHKIPVPEKYLNLVKLGMEKAMQIGTGRFVAQGAKYTIAGKTGTAQVVGLQANSRKSKFSGEKYKDHSWFIAFAPVENPKIAIAVLVENGGFGASAAGPIVRKLFDSYLAESKPLTESASFNSTAN